MDKTRWSPTQILLLILMILIAIAIIALGIYIIAPAAIPADLLGPTRAQESTLAYTSTPEPPHILLFTLFPAEQIVIGECIQIQWQVDSNANRVIIRRDSEVLLDGSTLSDTFQDCPIDNRRSTYRIEAIGPGGSERIDKELVVNTTVEDTPTLQTIEIISFKVSPQEIPVGKCIGISWNVIGEPESIQIFRNDTLIQDQATRAGNNQDCPEQAGVLTYRIEASDTSGTQTALSAPIVVIAPTPEPSTPIVGRWLLVFYATPQSGYAALIPGSSISATFTVDGNLAGLAGCNTYNTSYTETEEGELIISPPSSTKKFCVAPTGIMDQEIAFLELLPEAALYQVSTGRLEIFDALGNKIMVFTVYKSEIKNGQN